MLLCNHGSWLRGLKLRLPGLFYVRPVNLTKRHLRV